MRSLVESFKTQPSHDLSKSKESGVVSALLDILEDNEFWTEKTNKQRKEIAKPMTMKSFLVGGGMTVDSADVSIPNAQAWRSQNIVRLLFASWL
jgi:hypothetical protein